MDYLRIVLLALIASILFFFLYQIVNVMYKRYNHTNEFRENLVNATYVEDDTPQMKIHASEMAVGLQEPEIPGQTRQEVLEKEPLQQSVSRMQQSEPESFAQPTSNEGEASFGNNLRHPEASFQPHPYAEGSMQPELDSGRAGAHASPGMGNQVQYSTEMAQNGGEFLKGIFAFDKNDNTNFSSF